MTYLYLSFNFEQRKANGGKDGKAYLIRSYRHYADVGSSSCKKLIKKCDGLTECEIENILFREFGFTVDMADVDISENVDIQRVDGLAKEEREVVLNKMIAAPGFTLN